MSRMERRMAGIAVTRGAAKRPVAIVDLLDWAFAREKVRLDFDAGEDGMQAWGYGYVSSTAAIIRHEQLGCRVDGGGSSPCHPDADTVAAAVAALPEGCGGRRMAIWIAELARAGQVPDCMADARPICEPVDWQCNRHGWSAKSVVVDRIETPGRGGRMVQCDVRLCPVRYRNSAQEIAAARRRWLGWWGALRDLRETFRIYGGLTAFEVTEVMPPRQPWKKGLTKS
ncbi:hypothetical protein [Antarcticimicrobium luteum]|uniref:Uncharacterized protein n=1 Tax=Antarcticimicrobium luteum TaxID=2547397 RepID=A0A4R5VH13_9RHOB|nr:hypothetical protein [Antarcticimicrobium luteum]TDK51149.1 hypothetical protein E1832_04040 [Antarcticimicrobium luteum]